ncbi:MAG: tRNA (Guanosine(18)-2'-O)-methyltransferase [uncultured Thiotrichaceae bacterium]|uniref:tRNA (Guanosine(18)-2'-O)-methyltransferase n=1 Tax=uncultured Thiotrichaceae bacterium TaxID=298394 RepID=A0A6S6SCL1_9GAMM|nr:MAG: tRNA (Guanosine(18)-2'-O)-methyltransferase [uncultured Thiotrichaceae bacterium]
MVSKNQQLEHHMHQENEDKFPLTFLAHNIDVTRNIGGLFRIADALGVEKIYLTGSSFTPENPKVKKSSRSTIKYVSFEYAEGPLPIIAHLQKEGYTIVSLEITSKSIPLSALCLDKAENVCLILGSENEGVSQVLLDASDITVHIPMSGVNSSMNVVTACAIASYEITKQLEVGRNA